MRLSMVSFLPFGWKMWCTLCWDIYCVVKCCAANCLKFVPYLPGLRRRLCDLVRHLSWYRCGRVFAKSAFLSFLLCICRAEMGTDAGSGMAGEPTLGDALGGGVWFGSIGGCNLRDSVTWDGCYGGMVSMNCNYSTSVMSSLRTGSPACNEGDVVEGGWVRILMMFLAACRKKPSNLTWGKGMVVGKR